MERTRTPLFFSLAVLVTAVVMLSGCRGGGIGGRRGSGATGSPGRGSGGKFASVVSLTAADLAAVDTYFRAGVGGSNTRWIIGDEIDVVASKEYFSQILSVNRGDLVSRTERSEGNATYITLKYLGAPNQVSAMTTPRVQIGVGLTVTAKKIIRVRLLPTSNSSIPVRLNVVARGSAKRGHKSEVLQRADIITTGGNLIQRAGRWVWVPTGS